MKMKMKQGFILLIVELTLLFFFNLFVFFFLYYFQLISNYFFFFYFFLGALKTGQGLVNGMKSTPPMKGTRTSGTLIPLSV